MYLTSGLETNVLAFLRWMISTQCQTNRACWICNSYTTVCLSVRGDNPWAVWSGLSPVHADKLWYNYSRFSLSRSRRDPLKHFEISVLRHNRCAEFRKIPNEQPNFTNEHVIWLLWLEIYVENIVYKGRNCSWGAISALIHNILLLDIRRGSDFLFEISGYSR